MRLSEMPDQKLGQLYRRAVARLQGRCPNNVRSAVKRSKWIATVDAIRREFERRQ